MNVTDTSKLTESPGPMLVKNGARCHDGEQIISHLNYSLGPMNWDWEEMERGYDEQADQVWVRGKLTARFIVESLSGDGFGIVSASKIECGWNEVKRKRENKSQLVDLGSDYKGADTDALKRAARLLGVGLDAWEKDRPQQQQRQAPELRPAQPGKSVGPTPLHDADRAAILTGAPASSADRSALLARYRDLLDHAKGVGFRASWVSTDPEAWNDIQIDKYSGLLASHIARNAAEAS